ncbi:MAG: tRNA (adenosine(37)-N6)-dimethylallyltransferase MiaA [Parcubacteria group bacterium CG1_02_58_44]|nr:MAG: tRNA (adenosine(37)-N6)-dimethylallyltransferase MiaA [Parcubacteria group bacterium CG1_02_58_44]
MLSRAVAVVGATASGKTALAMALAREFGGEIVSADSRQLYRGTAICTDIPTGKWKSYGNGRRQVYVVDGVAHYLLGSESPGHPLDLAEYHRRAEWRLKEIASRGRLPILVGGTGLYVRAVVDSFVGPEVAPNYAFRDELEKHDTAKLYRRLMKVDPDYAGRISPNNRRYVVRALEVQQATGRPFSEQQGQGRPQFEWLQLGADRSRDELYRRIDARVDWMADNGLVEEAQRMFRRYGSDSRIATSLGYAQLAGFLSGKYDLKEAFRLIKRDTRHYARRQLTWLRRDSRIRWVRDDSRAQGLVRRFIG